MGGSKKQTIGYNYFLGMHLVLARQIDALLQIKMASKPAWRGVLANGRGVVHQPELFGGQKREGGFSGAFDLLDGDNAQPINDYLQSQHGALTTAYRGVASLVFRRPNIGANSARLPDMEFKLCNFAGIHRGWEVPTALINAEASGGGAAIYITFDTTMSMGENNKLETAKTALAALMRSLKGTSNSVRLVAFSNVIHDAIERFECTDANYEELALWMEAYTELSFGGDWTLAVASAPAFFATDASIPRNLGTGVLGSPGLFGLGTGSASSEARRKIVIFISDGGPTPSTVAPAAATLNSIPNVEVFCINIQDPDISYALVLDNTPSDGVPVVGSGDPYFLLSALSGATLMWADMNPAHIIRCLWTDPMRGGVAQESEIGDSFVEAANLFYAERFGLSVPFRGADLVESDRLEVERHADAVSYRSRRTGKIELKVIRNDYDPEDLPVLDSSIILEWSGLEKATRSETPNQLTVVYTKRDNGETASITNTNIAGVRRAGRVIPGEPVEYPFCTVASLAKRLCLRDLSVQDRPLLSGTLRLAYLPQELEIGEPFIINEPILGINNVIVRVLNSQEGDGTDNSVLISVTEDRYAMPLLSDGEGTIPTTLPTPRAEPSPFRVVQETPYYLMVLDQTQAEVDSALVDEPDLGTLLATGTKSTPAHLNITVANDLGAGYEAAGDVNFSPSIVTLSALSSEADDVVVTVPLSSELNGILPNSLAVIGTEIIRIDDFTDNGSNIDITIGRGCLDTVPVAHAIDARIVFIQNVDPLDTQYISGDVLSVKLLTNLNSEKLSLFSAPVDTVTMASRAIRPYPPGRFKLSGSYEQNRLVGDVVLSWVHRDRTMQTTLVPEDHDDAGIGPEVGVTYRVTVTALDALGDEISTVTDVNVGSTTTYDWNDTTALPSATVKLRFAVASVRGGYESWQKPSIDTVTLLPPANLVGVEL